MYLHKHEIQDLFKREKNSLIIRPLLEQSQIKDVTIDLRLGYDFLVSVQGRESSIDASLNDDNKHPIDSFFQETRRRIGDTFLLHPNQTVLASSLEYLKIPQDIYVSLNMRSSYSRLGLSISTIIQPGYCGCASLELTNANKNPIKLTVGAAIFQISLIQLSTSLNYFSEERKYICSVKPEVSAAIKDKDKVILNTLWKSMNHIQEEVPHQEEPKDPSQTAS